MNPEHTRNGLTLVVPQDVSATVREALLRLCCMGRKGRNDHDSDSKTVREKHHRLHAQ